MMRALFTLLLLGAATAASAQAVDERFWLQGAIYRPKVDTTARISVPGAGGDGTGVDFEQTLDFPERTTLPSVTMGARLGRNWRVVGEFYRLDRRRSAIIDQDIEFDGVHYPANAQVDARFGSDIYRLTAGYSIINRPKFELGASLGAHITSFVVALEGNGSVGNAGATLEARQRRVLAPLPTLGLYAEWRPGPLWLLSAKADALRVKLNDLDGRLLNLQASASYEVVPDLAVGLAWRRVRYRLDISRDDWSGILRYRFDGPTAFLEWRFGG